MYRLGALTPPAGVDGSARQATGGDLGLVGDWFTRFHAEAAPASPAADPVEAARRRVSQGQVWLWEWHGTPVAMAAQGSAAGVARIAPVFTPAEHRRRGYGAAVTARVSRACLDGGALVTAALRPLCELAISN